MKVLFLLLILFLAPSAQSSNPQDRLKELSHMFTGHFLKNGYSNFHILKFLRFCHKNNLEQGIHIIEYKNGKWNAINLIDNKRTSADPFVNWLNSFISNIPLKEGLRFIYFPEEIIHIWKDKTPLENQKIFSFLESFPLLINCTHPAINWSDKGVLIPDPFIFHESYKFKVNDILSRTQTPFEGRKPVIFFRGGTAGPFSIPYTLDNIKSNDRLNFILRKDLDVIKDAGVGSDEWLKNSSSSSANFRYWYERHIGPHRKPFADFVEHGQHKYLISMDGFGAAWSRVPYILFTGSVLMLRADCRQYFYHLLEPDVTHVTIEAGLANLKEVYTMLQANPEKAKAMGEAGRNFAQNYLTPEALKDYMRFVIQNLNEAYKPSQTFGEKVWDLGYNVLIFLGI